MIAIEFATDGDACLVLKALSDTARGTAYLRPAMAAVQPAAGEPGRPAEPPYLYVDPEFEDEARDLAANPPAPSAPSIRLPFPAFMDLFTEDEQLAIAGAAMTDARTKLWYDRAVGAQFISLDDPRLTAGLDAMVTTELISAARKDRVLQGLGPED